MIMYRVDVLDIMGEEGMERWQPDSYWDSREEAVGFLDKVTDEPGKVWRIVEVVGEVIF